MRRRFTGKRIASLLLSAVLLTSEAGSTGLTVYAAEPAAESAETVEEVSEDEVSEPAVSEDAAEESVSDDKANEGAAEDNPGDVDAQDSEECVRSYMSIDGVMDTNILAAGKEDEEDPSAGEFEDLGVEYTKYIYASTLKNGSELKLTENTDLVMDQDLTLSKISGDKYSLMVEGSGKLTVRGASPAVGVYNLEIKTDMYMNSTKGSNFTGYTKGSLALYSGKLELYGGAGLWAEGDAHIYSEVYAECADSAALIASKKIIIYSNAKVHLVGGRDEDCDYRFGMGAAYDLTVRKGATVYSDGTYGIYSQSGDIYLYGDVEACGELYGIYAWGDGNEGGNVYIDMPKQLKASADDGDGIHARHKIDMKSSVLASGTESAIWSEKGELDLTTNGLIINKPAGAKLRDDKKTIVNSSGKSVKEVEIFRKLSGGLAYVSPVRYGTRISTGKTGDLLNIDDSKLHFQWEISNNGEDGWSYISGATNSGYMPEAGQVGKYVRAGVTADGYVGKIYSNARQIEKRLNSNAPDLPGLSCSADYKTITVTNAKAAQEYLLSSNYTVSDSSWNNAKSPANNGSLSFSCNAGVLYYVHTRYKESATDEAGTKSVYTSVYTGKSANPKSLVFDKTEFSTKVGEVTALTVKPVPADVDGWNSFQLYWFVNGTGVELYQDKACTKTVPLSDTLVTYKTVYIKGTAQTRSVSIGVEKQIGYNELIHATISGKVADKNGNYALDHLSFEHLYLTPGEECITEYTTSPDPASVGTLSFVKKSGTSNLKIEKLDGKKVKVTVPENAAEGDYSYGVRVNGAETPVLSSIWITVSKTKMYSLTFDANGGTGYMAPVTVLPDTDYILPDCTFKAPDGKMFDGWDKGKAGEVVRFKSNSTLKAQWTDHEHDLLAMEANDPDCTNEGHIACYICRDCGKYFEDAEGKKELQESKVVIPATGHSLNFVNGVDADCVHTGYAAYYQCSKCSKCFYDSKGSNPVYDTGMLVIPADGHDWDAWKTDKPATDDEPGLRSRRCKRCAFTEYEEIPALKAAEFSITFADATMKMNSEGVYEVVYTGDEIKPNVLVKHNGVVLTESRDYTLKYSNNKKAGSTGKVTVSGKGSYSKSVSREFKIIQKDVEDLEVGNLVVKDGQKADPTVIHNGNILKVNKDYSLKQEGSDLVISGMGNYKGTKTVKLHEVEATDYNNRLINVKIGKVTRSYDGSEQYLNADELSVTDKDGKQLKAGTDYIVRYSNNVDAGMVRVTVTGIGNYVGKAKKTFKIMPAKDAKINITLDKTSYTYKKSGVKPKLTVIAEIGSYTTSLLYEGVDYKLAYSSNKKAGNGKFTIALRGNYKGAKYTGEKTYTIEAAKPSAYEVSVIAGNMPFKKAGKYRPKTWVIVNGSLLGKSDVKLEYAEEKLTEGKNNLKITASAAGSNYEFTGAEGLYTVAVSEKTDVSKAKVSFMQGSNKVKKMQYSGSAITFTSAKPDAPQICVTAGGKMISGAEVEKNFDIIYADNIEKGKATVILKAKSDSDYIGACAGNFTIVSYPVH